MKSQMARALDSSSLVGTHMSVYSASVDPVIHWNGVAAAALAAAISPAPPGTPLPVPPTRPGQVGGLDFAMVHVAVHDAVQAFEQRFEQYAGRFRQPRDLRPPLWPRPRTTSW